MAEVEIEPAEFSARYKDSKGEERPHFNLPRRECDLIIAGYSAKYRLAIIDRWQELEEEVKTLPSASIFPTLADLDIVENITAGVEYPKREESRFISFQQSLQKWRQSFTMTTFTIKISHRLLL